MSLKSTTTDYGTLAKFFHWATALLILGSYCTVYYRQWITEEKTPENWTALQLHLSIGVTIAVLVILRILWKLMDTSPAPEPGSKLEHLAAKAGHLALYALIIIMPVTGYLGTGVDTEYFFLFDITGFSDTQIFQTHFAPSMTFKEFEKPMDLIHKDILGSLLLWILIVGHIGAALYHHFVKKDRTLKRMTSGS